jgi:glycosyltransferase involved in cell wall biosynthesis
MNIMTIQITNQKKIIGGAYDRYMILINAFLNQGDTVHHISPDGFSNITHTNLIHHSVKPSPFSPKFLFFFAQSIFKIIPLMIYNRIDLIVTFSPLEALLGIFFKFFSRKTNLIVSFRCDSVASCSITDNNIKNKFLIYFLNLIDKIAINNSDLVIFISNRNKDDILKRTGIISTDKIKVVYNGITPRLEELGKAERVEFYGEEKIIGYVGLLFQGKGVRYLVEAFAKLLQNDDLLKLVIVGDGPEKKNLEDIARQMNIQDKIVFTGYQKNPIKYIKGFDLLVVPSLVEPFGIVILEAFYVGTPVIGACVGGITEILKYSELLFKPKDANDLELKLLNILGKESSYKNIVELCEKRSKCFNEEWVSKMMDVMLKLNGN